MRLANSPARYGLVTQALHWVMLALFLYQFLGANLMTRVAREQTVLGLSQGSWYNGHKSIGLVLLALAFARVAWRRLGGLPDWAPALTVAERAISHRNEALLYWGMFLMPLSGYVFVMAGDYGVKLFGAWDLANPIGKHATLAGVARVGHVLVSYAVVVVVSWHVGLGIKKHVFERTGFLRRMLPFTRP